MVDTISTSADREDHVSMGMIAARHFGTIVDHCEHVLAIEALAAAQGIWLRKLSPGRGVAQAVDRIRQAVPPLEQDRPLYRDFAAVREIVSTGALLDAADRV